MTNLATPGCPGCRLAETEPCTVIAYAHCLGCDARAMASGRLYEQSASTGTITKEYRRALGQVFGDRWKDGHEMVKKWAGRMKERA